MTRRVRGLRGRILALDAAIATLEPELNALAYRLHGLSAEEVSMVEGG